MQQLIRFLHLQLLFSVCALLPLSIQSTELTLNDFSDKCDGFTEQFITEIPCTSTRCTSLNTNQIVIDISAYTSIVICLPLTQSSLIDLSNIIFKTSGVTQQIILSASQVHLSKVNFIQTNSSFQIPSFIIQSSSMTQLVSSILPNATTTQLQAQSLNLTNTTIASSTLAVWSLLNAMTTNNLTIATTGSASFTSASSISMQSLSLSQASTIPYSPSANNPVITFNSSSLLNIWNSSITTSSASVILISDIPIINADSSSSLVSLSSSTITSPSLLSIISYNSISLLETTLNSANLILATSPTPLNSTINLQNSTISTTNRTCKSDCSESFTTQTQQMCTLPEYNPIISLLADSNTTLGTFSINATYSRYNLSSFSDLVQLVSNNFTSTVITMQNFTMKNTSILSSNIGVYSESIFISDDSSVLANEQGCLGAHGAGGGIIDIIMRMKLLCGGPGGSHGMVGGSPISENQEYYEQCYEILGQQTYGSPAYPVFEGSGGGGYCVPANSDQIDLSETFAQTETYAGQGGGFVYLEAFNITLNGAIDVSGGMPNKDYSYLGSGSGGSVQVHAANITGTGNIYANGGDQTTQGGEGGAGRVKVNVTTWASASNEQIIQSGSLNSIMIQLQQGQTTLTSQSLSFINDQGSVRNGSLIATPCPPGFHPRDSQFACVQCPPGFFSSSYDLNPCRLCLNNLGSSRVNFTVDEVQTMGECTFSCSVGYTAKQVNGAKQCLTNIEVFTESIGGDLVILGAVLAISSILLNIAVVAIYESLKRMKKIQKQVRMQKPVNKTKVRMAIEDLPFHEQRIYIEGENTHIKPWRVSLEVKNQIVQVLRRRGYLKLQLDGTVFKTQPQKERDSSYFSASDYKNEVNEMSFSNSFALDPFSRNQSAFDVKPIEQLNSFLDSSSEAGMSWNLWKEIEKAAKYTFWQRLMLYTTQTVFPFAYYYIGEKYKQRKWKNMKLVISSLLLELKLSGCSMALKFSCSSCFCQAFFDIVDYSKTELQWDIQAKMPLCLLLQGKGSFMSPFLLNDSDPLMALLVTYIKEKSQQINFNEDSQAEGGFEFDDLSRTNPVNHETANDLIRLVQCFFNKLNALSRMICFVSDIKTYKKSFMEFVRFISENQDIFELLELNVQVSIHKVNKISKQPEASTLKKDLAMKAAKNARMDDYDGFAELEETENSSVTVLPSKIKSGSFAEKQFELELERSYQRKKLRNDFEMKISLIFSREKIYEFDKQYVQEMDSINTQLEWVCYPHKDQVRILLQHTEEHQNFASLLRHVDLPAKDSIDSIQFEMREISASEDISQRQIALHVEQNVLNKSQQSLRSHSFSTSKTPLHQIDNQEDFMRKLSAMNYTFMYEMLKDHQPIDRKSKSLLYCFRYIAIQIFHSFSRCKEISQSYRQFDSKVLSNTRFIRFLLFIFILTKILFYWLIHIAPFSDVLLGQSSTYNTVFLFIESAIFPFATMLCVFYQLIWIIKQDTLSGKMCMILNSMEIISTIIAIPLAIPLLIINSNCWTPLLYNTIFLLQNMFVGFIGSIFLYQIKEKPIILSQPNIK